MKYVCSWLLAVLQRSLPLLTFGAVVFLIGCFSSDNQFEIDKDLKQLRDQNIANQKALDIMHCETGVLFTVTEFQSLIKGKAKKGQLDRIWAKCEESVK